MDSVISDVCKGIQNMFNKSISNENDIYLITFNDNAHIYKNKNVNVQVYY